jgi:3-oxoadipate enol-lactonase
VPTVAPGHPEPERTTKKRGGVRVRTDDGVDLAVVEAGTGPPLLLVHGFGGAKEDFADHLAALGERARVVAFDHRGHGESGKPDVAAAYSLDRLAADTLAVADALGFESFRLLGHSMGGMVARRVLLAAPERVDAVVFMDTGAGPPPGLELEVVRVGAELALSPGGMATLREILDDAAVLGSEADRRLMEGRPGYREFGRRKWEALAPMMWATLAVEMVEQPDQLDALRALCCPALVIVGEQDETFLDASRTLAASIPGARLVEIRDAGHSPQFETPAAWLAALEGFLYA